MKKLFIVVLMQTLFVSGQISTTPFHVTRPTPSVASLMNFSDIPVNLFTGVPDVSIPIYNFPTRSKDVNFNIALKYHPASISFIDKASDVGLGWSLFSGGTIARNITNEPDDVNFQYGVPNTNLFDDVYSFNFMGYTGSFLIKRDIPTNTFSVQIRDDNNSKLKIEFDINPTTFSVNSFTIYDNKGYKYDFVVYDLNVTRVHTFIPGIPTTNPSSSSPVQYRSAHHLTKVTDNNGKVLVNISYNAYNTNTLGDPFYDNSMKKINEVSVEGQGKAFFNYSLNPTQYLANDILQLDAITIKDVNSVTINKYSFVYGQTNFVDSNTGTGIRRLLVNVIVANKNNASDMNYELSYKLSLPESILEAIQDYTIGHDGFGYFNITKNCDVYNGVLAIPSLKTTPEFSGHGVLDRIRYPTGGSAIFDFESNRYSYANNNANAAIDDNNYYIDNPIDNVTPTVIASTNYTTVLSHASFQFQITNAKTYYIQLSHTPYGYPPGIIPPDNNEIPGVTYILTSSSWGANNSGLYLNDYDDNEAASCLGRPIYLLPGIYTITMTTPPATNTTGKITITEKINNPTLKKWIYGAGVRIKQIAYFKTNAFPDYFTNPNTYAGNTPSRHLKYEYKAFNDHLKSSGCLIPGVTDIYSSFASSEIGYTNVKVSEVPNNGYELFTFASPYESPIINPNLGGFAEWPHILAYQSGILRKKETYDKLGNLLAVTDNVFEYVEDATAPFSSGLINQSYLTRSSWAKLTSSTNTSYFYPNQNSITTTDNFTYNTFNKQIESKTFTNSLGENVTTNYTYDNANSSFSKNRIAEIKNITTSKNGTVLSSSEIEYGFSLPNNSSYLPKTIRTSKDSQAYEDRVQYNVYDEYSNPLEIQQQSGTVTSYIWGYNKTQPIAKIENATNAEIATILGTSLSAINESSMSSINNLRTSLPNAMVTTFTYIPLVGISTITDPKGDKLTYEYDDFNRLKWVKDKNNNILSENQYAYRVNNFALNFVKSITYKIPTTASITSPTPSQAVINKTFFDGLGKPIQQIAHAQSATGKDIVTHIEYDLFGRKIIDYLPYANSAASLDYNEYAKTELLNYPDYIGQNPYSEKVLEASPLNRILKQGAPGNDWAINPTGADHTIKFDYQANISNEVKRYTATSNSALVQISFVHNGNYPPNVLYKSITKNENWTSGDNNTTQEFKDKEGRVILKRNFGVSVVNGVNVNTNHDTYYVYDQYGNLTYVIPPLADGTISTAVLDDLCYQYKYDYRNRLVEKKSPAKQWEFIVYDKLDRVVYTGPTFTPFGGTAIGWMFIKYDAFGRVCYTGWQQGNVINSTTRNLLQNNYNSTTNPLFETKSTAASTINNVSFNYTNVSLPTTNYHVLSVNYFDDYNYTGAPTTFSTVMHDNSQPVYYNNTTFKPKGLPTGSWIRILEASTTTPVRAEASYILYDNNARAVRARTNNYLTGYTQVDSKIDFAGKLLYKETKHKRESGSNELYIREDFTYSDQDRLLTHIHKIGLTGMPQLLSKKEYNELGQMIGKDVGGTDTTTFTGLQKVNYNYNIRGWLTNINDISNLAQASDAEDLFAFKINYNDVQNETNYNGTALYNGNISEVYWLSKSDNIVRKYGYEYDDLNRLKNAIYQKPNTAIAVTNSYNESMTYDKNGNIRNLQRYGDRDTSDFNIKIDDLAYTYHPNEKNKLMKVFDAEAHPEGFKDDSVDGLTDPVDDYSYDLNGNMTADQNKGITTIKYNHLNLPTQIIFGNGNNIYYLYNALGQKVQKSVVEVGTNPSTTITDYLNGCQYTNNILNFFPHTEGYVSAIAACGICPVNPDYYFNYVFNYTDHLGNIRVSYAVDPQTAVIKILEENHYYPFGLKHTNYNTNTDIFDLEEFVLLPKIKSIPAGFTRHYKYKFEGKEWQDELALNLYDFGGRLYDPATVRTTTIDPLAEKFYHLSPQSFLNNNPLSFIDPTGMSTEDIMPPDDYLIKQNGNIEVTKTNDKFDKFSIENKQGKEEFITQINKNENGLLQLPSKVDFNSSDANSSFSLTTKEGNEYRSFIRGDAAAALFGAASDANVQDLVVVGFSLSDGASPSPSTSHKLGKNGDLRYLNVNENGAGTNINDSSFDSKRESNLTNGLFKYGWKDMISEKFNGGKLLPHTSSGKARGIPSDHTTHLHLQGFNPKLIKK